MKISNSKEPESKVPKDFGKALAGNAKAKAQWQYLTPISRRDFISWIESAKQEETRNRRISIACSKLVAGNRRPCCYAVVPMILYKALGANPKAKAVWNGLAPEAKRDFADWVDSGKDADERKQRVEKTCALLATGKKQN